MRGVERAGEVEELPDLVRILLSGPALDPGRHVDGGRAAQRDRRFQVGDRQAAREQPGPRQSKALEQAPVERQAVAAGQASGFLRRSRIEQDHVGDLGMSRNGGQILRLGHRQRLDHDPAGARP